jgi:putative hemolysin
MSLTARLHDQFEAEARRAHSKFRLRVSLADTLEDLRAAQRLRHAVFVEEMGARVPAAESGIESDRYDHYCQHLLVRDEACGQVVGCYRILTDTQARRAGGFYSQGEFDLTNILAQPGRFMEVGRTCVHPDYRNGAVIALLWSGLARYMLMHRYDYLMGCASIPLRAGTHEAHAIFQQLRRDYLSDDTLRVQPRQSLPQLGLTDRDEQRVTIPPLLKAYLRVGARICGEPAWDREFNVADLFLLLRADDIVGRYARHFLNRA